jgi:small subunit ribosomal protein S1
MEEVKANTEENFQELFEKSLAELEIEEKTIIKGTVIEVQDKGVMINVGFKSEGFVPLHEFTNENGEITVKPGEEVEVFVVSKEDGFGRIRLSRKKAIQLMAWGKIKEFFEDGRVINGFVTKKINGGFEVDLKGIKAFLPYSLADIRPVKNLNFFLNRYYDFKIINLNEKNFNVVLDRKTLLEESLNRKKEKIYSNLELNKIIESKINFVKDEGATIDFGANIYGFLPASNISWGRVKSAKNYLRRGDIIKCKIVELDKEKDKIILSIKHINPNPWENAEEKYKSGKKIKGKVVSLQDFGAFIELEPGVDGLLHVSEISWTRKKIHPSKILQLGEIVEVMVKEVNIEEQRISLSLKAILPTPWEILESKYKVGDRIKGSIRSISPFGLFVDVGEDENAFIHKNDISWTKRFVDLKENYAVGQEVEGIIIDLDKENKKFHVSIKHLFDDPFKTFLENHKEGDIIEGNVTNIESFGLFVNLGNEIEGLVHISQISTERVKNPEDIYKVGDKVTAVIKNIDKEQRKISLSIRDYLTKEEEKEIQQYKKIDEPLAKIGDILIQNQP